MRVLATHSIRQFPLHFPSRALPCATRFRTSSTIYTYRGADKSLTRPTSRCILFDGENISFDASLVIYINSINIPPVMIINSCSLFSFWSG